MAEGQDGQWVTINGRHILFSNEENKMLDYLDGKVNPDAPKEKGFSSALRAARIGNPKAFKEAFNALKNDYDLNPEANIFAEGRIGRAYSKAADILEKAGYPVRGASKFRKMAARGL